MAVAASVAVWDLAVASMEASLAARHFQAAFTPDSAEAWDSQAASLGDSVVGRFSQVVFTIPLPAERVSLVHSAAGRAFSVGSAARTSAPISEISGAIVSTCGRILGIFDAT